MPAPKGPVLLRTGPAGPIVWPWSNSDTRPCQKRVGLDRDAAPCLAAVRQCREVLAEANFHPPSWRDLAVVVPERAEEVEPNQPKFGWQQHASRSLETKFLNERVWPQMTDAARALLRSQRGPLASAAVTALPTTRATRTDHSAFCCSDASGSPCPCPPAPADVAAHLTHLATIAQRALRHRCWVGGFLTGSCRCASVQRSRGTCLHGTWTWRRLMSWTADALKSWQMA